MPKFEEFSREDSRASREGPMFTLQARGLISLNQAAFTALDKPDAVALLYDTAENIVAMRKVPKSHQNAYTVRKQQQAQSYVVGAQGFIAHYGIPTQRARRFPGHDYGQGAWGFALQEGTVVQNRRGRRPGPPVTDRWRHTTNGFEVPELMRITHVGMSHPGYMRRGPGDKPPSVRVGMLVACSPLGPKPATSELRSRFLGFLGWTPVMGLITSLSHIDANVSWAPWGGHGRINFEAVLTDGSEEGAPIVSALLLLPEQGEQGESRYGRDARFAELVLDIEPRGPEGGPAVPANLATWHARLTQVLALPTQLGRFLTDELGLITSDDPPAQVGVWLTTQRSMTELVDVEQLKTVQGAMPSSQFIGWALADPNGEDADGAAVDWLTAMCDNTLHLDGYEPVLERMRTGRKDVLRIGERLPVGRSLYSADGRFRLEVHQDGNLIVHWGRRYLWKSDTARSRGAYYLTLQEDGNLVLWTDDGEPIWATGTVGQGAESLVMQSDGNLVLYSKTGAVWSSGIVLAQDA
jgi:hypothetical protein